LHIKRMNYIYNLLNDNLNGKIHSEEIILKKDK
jgi:stress-induced morphogen